MISGWASNSGYTLLGGGLRAAAISYEVSLVILLLYFLVLIKGLKQLGEFERYQRANSIWWNYGSLLGLCLSIQIVASVVHICRDVDFFFFFNLSLSTYTSVEVCITVPMRCIRNWILIWSVQQSLELECKFKKNKNNEFCDSFQKIYILCCPLAMKSY